MITKHSDQAELPFERGKYNLISYHNGRLHKLAIHIHIHLINSIENSKC